MIGPVGLREYCPLRAADVLVDGRRTEHTRGRRLRAGQRTYGYEEVASCFLTTSENIDYSTRYRKGLQHQAYRTHRGEFEDAHQMPM
jgi:hypothetical protein